MARRSKVPPTFSLSGNATEAGHDEHVLILSDTGAAVLVAAIESLLGHEGHLLDQQEIKVITAMRDALREGLAAGVENRRNTQLH